MNNYSKLGLYLSIGIIIAAFIIAYNYRSAKKHSDMVNQTIEVKGYAEKQIISDYATWSGNINCRAYSLNAAYELLEKHRLITKDYLISKDLNEEDINFSQINVMTNYKVNNMGYSTNEVLDYTLSQMISLESDDIDLITDISKDITSLIQKGVNIASYPPQYLYTKLDELKITMLSEAAMNAKERAVELSTSTGSEIGPLTYARQGVFQITSTHSNEISDYGMYDTRSIEKSIKAVVTMKFAIR
jgi:hypothetical protein